MSLVVGVRLGLLKQNLTNKIQQNGVTRAKTQDTKPRFNS